jgi:hypothetical protein
MSLFSRLKKSESDIKTQMLDCISAFMGKYATDNQGNIEDVAYIFAHAIQMINALSNRQLTKAMHSNNVNAECGALNTLQNCAMTEIKPVSGVDFITGCEDGPYKLYRAINDEKLNKGYISKAQYDENEMLGTKLHLIPPGGVWL